MFWNYRKGLEAHESEAIRQLRRRGFAVVLLSPRDVGDPLNRGIIEAAMLKAGKATLREKKGARQ
jgi:hypothetical protein